MAKRYDPILCMLVDEPTKTHDAFVLRHSNGDYMSDRGRVKNLSNAKVFNSKSDAESFRKEDIIEDMIEEHGEEKVGKMLNTFNEMFSKGKEKKKENPVVAKKKNESANSNASAREKLSGMSRSDLEHFAEMYGGYEDARGIRKDDIIDDMIDDYGEEKVNKMLETYNGIFKRR